ncbi:N-terminal phage integrase SAM-like domain-containing protein [Marinobacterium rhizophilum]|uniref:Site-specific integrase n=1 Tax=Marinobacterium rhizophilum TaxID=420402 RepID=A0ABY5HIH7_9GAMM|nr:N-terminal phage integrase SAM-like domain-containing protein [Marinobacterium rhizophilum]UTW11418.1 site-specific integrase [Marinobacterium rhizophilum]
MDKESLILRILNMHPSQYESLLAQLESTEKTSESDASKSIKTERVKVDDTLSLYRQRHKTKYWSARIVLDSQGRKEEVRFSTGKSSVEAAGVKAIEERFKLIGKIEAGYSIKIGANLLFKAIASKVIEEMEAVVADPTVKKTTYKSYISLLKQHIIPFFGDTNIKNIDYPMIVEYFEQTTVKSKSQITMQKTSIGKVFEYAVKKRLIDQLSVPKFPKVITVSDPDYRVEPFSEHDLKVLNDNYPSFIRAGRKEQTKHYRRAFQHYFSFLLSTGVRPGEEPKGIRFKDISKHQDAESGNYYYVIKLHKGKTQKRNIKYRQIAIDATAVKSIEAAAKELNGFVVEERIDWLIKNYSERFVFKSYRYNAFPSYDRIFSQEQYLGYVADKLHHQNYKPYSCRHTYINNQLAAGVAHNDIAEHCGNSIQVIETHYKRAKLMTKAPSHIAGNIVDYEDALGLPGFVELVKSKLESGVHVFGPPKK